jgi:hypothetical protein
MNASSQRSSGKRPILDAFYTALRVSDVCFATFGARFFGMCGAGKVGSFATQQSSPLFGFGCFRCDRSKPRLTNFLSGFLGSNVSTGHGQHIGVAFFEMFFAGKALKILQSIVRFVVIYVVNLFSGVKIWHPALRHDAMNKVLAAHTQIAAVMKARCVWPQLSKNFPATRYSVKVVKESVFGSVYHYAGHGVPFGAVKGDQVLTQL